MTQLREAIKGRLIQMEEALFIASGQRFEPESEAAAEAMFLSGQHPLLSITQEHFNADYLEHVMVKVPT